MHVWVWAAFGLAAVAQALHPIIFVPGDGGNKMWAKLNKTHDEHWYCDKHSDWYLLWVDFDIFILPFPRNCFLENIQLHYNVSTRSTMNAEGVETRVQDPGLISGMKTLDSYGLYTYYGDMIDKLIKEGYTAGKDLVGVSLDWRKAANEQTEKLDAISDFAETLYNDNNQSSVYIISHSMGGLMTKYLLENKSQKWKNKYIKGWISIATPMYGAPETYEMMASGYNLDVPTLPVEQIKYAQRSWPSSAWLLPNPDFWNTSEAIVQTPEKNYTVLDYHEFFTDIDYMTGYYLYEDTHRLLNFDPPAVDLYCIYGTELKTPERFIYNSKFPNKPPKTTIYSDGDGTVPFSSAKGCGSFSQKQIIQERSFPGEEHVGLLKAKAVINYVSEIVFS